jgi:hypothetical protein
VPAALASLVAPSANPRATAPLLTAGSVRAADDQRAAGETASHWSVVAGLLPASQVMPPTADEQWYRFDVVLGDVHLNAR